MNAIFRRRSIRKFLDTPVPAEDVKKILMAGMAAPSAADGIRPDRSARAGCNGPVRSGFAGCSASPCAPPP